MKKTKKTATKKTAVKKNKGSEKLMKIIAKAKEIRAKSPRTKWQNCVSKASKLVK